MGCAALSQGEGCDVFPDALLSSLGYAFEIDSNYETHFDFASEGISEHIFAVAVFAIFLGAALAWSGASRAARGVSKAAELVFHNDVEEDADAHDGVAPSRGHLRSNKCCCCCPRPSFKFVMLSYAVLLILRVFLGFTDIVSSAPDLQFCLAAATYYATTRWLRNPRACTIILSFAVALYIGVVAGASIDSKLVTVLTEADATDFNLYFGETPTQSLRMFTDKTGRYPVPAKWLFGPWYLLRGGAIEESPFGKSGADAAEAFVQRDIPVAQMMREVQFLPEMPFDDQFATLRAENDKFHSLGVKTTCYFNEFVHARRFHNRTTAVFNEAKRLGVLTKDKAGDPYTMHFHVGIEGFRIRIGGEQVAQFDFSNPSAVAFYQGLLLFAANLGYDGWKYDYGEYTPQDALSFDGTDGAAMHNLYPVLYQQACQSLFERMDANKTKPGYGPDHIFFVRSGYTGTQRVTPAVWTGDSCSDWTAAFGLPAHLIAMLNLGLSGVPVSGSDAGGFVWVLQPPPSLELNVRWTQLSAFSGLMEYMAGGFGIRNKTRILDTPEGVALYRRYAKLRTQLFPHIYAAAHAARDEGLPIMRHHLLDFPHDAEAVSVGGTQFMFGEALLVAPVLAPGETMRGVYLPVTSGAQWHDVGSRLQYDESDGRFRIARASGAAAYDGGQHVTVPAPLETTPLFALGGSVVFLVDPAVDTVNDDIATSPLVTTLAARAHVMHAWVWPTASGAARGESYDGAVLSVGPVHAGITDANTTQSVLPIRLESDDIVDVERSLVLQVSVAAADGARVAVDGVAMAASWADVAADDAPVPSWYVDADAGTIWARISRHSPSLEIVCTLSSEHVTEAPCLAFV